MLTLDHIAVLGETLAEATTHAETALGVPLRAGGRHPRFGTHNQLIGLDPDLYLEAIAIDPSAEEPQDARWFGLDHFCGAARLDKWICRVEDMDAALAALPMAGRAVPVERDGLCWTMAVPEDGKLPFDGLFPALIQWHTDVLPGQTLSGFGLRLEAVDVSHPEAETLKALLAPYLQAPLVGFRTGPAGLSARITRGDETVLLA